MKAGDMIKLNGSFDKDRIGILVSLKDVGSGFDGWWNILDCDGRLVVWPESQIEVISEVD
tara:strand:+ start:102 stop:281 length:180 start_codon:yes stop_codon:yes gene_type:complete